MQKFVVGLDGSTHADAVLARAEALARVSGAKLVLFRSVSIPPDLALAWPSPDKPLELVLRTEAEKYLDACALRIPAELLDGVRVAVGNAWRAVCAAAVDEDADLIIIGSHGYGGVDYVLGTTASRIVNHASCSVLVVRERISRARRHASHPPASRGSR